MATRSIMWFRRDLRLDDHPALCAALAEGEVLPLFVIDPSMASAAPARRALLHDRLRRLDAATGGALVIRWGDPVEEVVAIAHEVGASAVYVTADFGPYGRTRDDTVADALGAGGHRLHRVGSPYAVAPGTIVKSDGLPYAVFTPFARRWQEHGWPAPLAPPHDPVWCSAASDGLGERPDREHHLPEPGQRWKTFRSGALSEYVTGRDLPASDGTSRLSADLKLGVVHPRQLLADLDLDNEAHHRFALELAWREFYADVLYQRPGSAWSNLDERFDAIKLDDGQAGREKFARWCAGTTGYPIVDAGMRQLAETGWMHNRARMITASFLVKDLHLPWWWGARYFMRHLVDGDLASNNHGWQWVAGSGTDAAPYFRVFSPARQQERFDTDGEYVERWVPEYGTEAYPAPMVDHAVERLEAIARYEAVKRHT